jgi:putative membrane protein
MRVRRLTRRQAAYLVGALATLFLALGPLDRLAEHRLFTAHMAQHLLLALVLPPLLLLGTPAWALRPLVRRRWIRAFARFATHPLVAFTVYNGFVAVMHVPVVYELMVRDALVHAALHAGLLATGVLLWWPLVSPLPELPRLPYPAQALYLFLLLIPMAAVSAPITLATEVLYPWYRGGPHPFGLAPLTDQELGGLLMWVGAGLYFMSVFTLMFARWARREDCDEPPRPARVVWEAR